MPLSYQDVRRCFWQCGAKMYISESSILFVCHLLACRQQQQLLAQPGRGQCPIRLITSMLRMLLISCTHPTHLRLNPRSRLYSYCQKHAGHLHLVGLRCAEWDCDMSAAAVLVIGQYIAHFAASSNFTSLGRIANSVEPHPCVWLLSCDSWKAQGHNAYTHAKCRFESLWEFGFVRNRLSS